MCIRDRPRGFTLPTTSPCIQLDTLCDPACRCGNFLIQAYKHLHGLEFTIITRAEEIELAEINAALDRHTQGEKVNGVRAIWIRLQEIGARNSMQFAEDAFRKSKMSMRQFHGIDINEWPAKIASTAMLLVDHLCNQAFGQSVVCLLYTSPSPRDGLLSRMPSSA